MTRSAKSIPDGYHSLTSYLFIKDAGRAIDFYKQAFGAVEIMRFPGPGDKIMHAEIKIGDSILMLADECPAMGVRSPDPAHGAGSLLLLYVSDVDAVTALATAGGAKILRPLENQFYGDRSATVLDPFGHMWTIATHIEDVPPEELHRRMQAMMEKKGS